MGLKYKTQNTTKQNNKTTKQQNKKWDKKWDNFIRWQGIKVLCIENPFKKK